MGSYLTERLALVATIDPDALDVGTHHSDPVNLAHHRKVLWLLPLGSLGGPNGTVDVELQQADTDDGTYTAIAGKALAQYSYTAGDHYEQGIIELDADELAPGNPWARAAVTVAGNNSYVSLVAIAGDHRFTPPADTQLASLTQIAR